MQDNGEINRALSAALESQARCEDARRVLQEYADARRNCRAACTSLCHASARCAECTGVTLCTAFVKAAEAYEESAEACEKALADYHAALVATMGQRGGILRHAWTAHRATWSAGPAGLPSAN